MPNEVAETTHHDPISSCPTSPTTTTGESQSHVMLSTASVRSARLRSASARRSLRRDREYMIGMASALTREALRQVHDVEPDRVVPRDRRLEDAGLTGRAAPAAPARDPCSLHHRKSRGPTTPPRTAHRAIVRPYQRAMNGNESSVQCSAYANALMPPAARPAMAPASVRFVGAN